MPKLLTFFSKNTCELDIVLNRTVNILTTNELVKLRMVEQLGPGLMAPFGSYICWNRATLSSTAVWVILRFFFLFFIFHYSSWTDSIKNINSYPGKATIRNTAFQRYRKKKRWGTNNNNFTVQLQIYCQRWCAEGRRHATVSTSRKHAYIFFDHLKPHFYIVKLGFTGVYIIFVISAQKHRIWVLVWTASTRRF